MTDLRVIFAGRLWAKKITKHGDIWLPDGFDEDEERGILISREKVTVDFVRDLVSNMTGQKTNISKFRYHDTGQSSAAEANTDSGLVSPTGPGTRAEGTREYVSITNGARYRTVATVGPYSTAATIREHIVADSASRATSNILDRSVFSGIPVEAGDSIRFVYELDILAEA